MTKVLTAALQQRENDFRRVVDRLDDNDAFRDGERNLLREAVELVGCLRRLVSMRTPEEIHRAFGAPGDFGYETPIGEALAKIYRGES